MKTYRSRNELRTFSRNRRAWRWITALTVFVLIAAACGGDDEPVTVVVTGAPGAAGEAGAEGEAGAAGEAGQLPAVPTGPSGTITINMYQKFVNGNPFTTGVDVLPSYLIYEGLVFLNNENAVTSRIAAATVSADAKTFTFDLKDDVLWSDGEAFTSDDVLFSYSAYAAEGAIFSSVFNGVTGIDAWRAGGHAGSPTGFSAPDADTFVIQLDIAFGPFLTRLSNPMLWILPEHVLGSMDLDALRDDANPFWTDPVGLGPFVLINVVADQYLEYVHNPLYHTPASLERIFVVTQPSETGLASLQTGELSYLQIGTEDFIALKTNRNVTTYSAPGVQGIHMVVNLLKPHLADVRIRQAMLYAINRQGIIDIVLGGQADLPLSFPFGPPWAVSSDLNPYAFDPEKAMELMAEAGWDPDQEVLIDIIPGVRDRERALDVVVGNLQAVGFKITVRQLQVGPYLDARRDNSFDLSFSGTEIGSIDPDIGFVSIQCDAYYSDGGGTNFANYCNREVDRLFLEARELSDQAERGALYMEATEIINREVPYIVLYVPKILYATSADLLGFVPKPDFTQAFFQALDWSLAE